MEISNTNVREVGAKLSREFSSTGMSVPPITRAVMLFSPLPRSQRQNEAHVNEHCTSAKMLSEKQNFN